MHVLGEKPMHRLQAPQRPARDAPYVRHAVCGAAEATDAIVCGAVRTQLLENAASFLGSQQDVVTQFQEALASNLTVVRMFGHGVVTGFYLQNPAAMGTYNEQAFRAFDYVLDQAARHQLRLVISFADNWDTDSNSDNKCARPPTSAVGVPAPLWHCSGSWRCTAHAG